VGSVDLATWTQDATHADVSCEPSCIEKQGLRIIGLGLVMWPVIAYNEMSESHSLGNKRKPCRHQRHQLHCQRAIRYSHCNSVIKQSLKQNFYVHLKGLPKYRKYWAFLPPAALLCSHDHLSDRVPYSVNEAKVCRNCYFTRMKQRISECESKVPSGLAIELLVLKSTTW
jgi:hypothetical protein